MDKRIIILGLFVLTLAVVAAIYLLPTPSPVLPTPTTIMGSTDPVKIEEVPILPVAKLRLIIENNNYGPDLRYAAASRLLTENEPYVIARIMQMLRRKNQNVNWRAHCVELLRRYYENEPLLEISAVLFQACSYPEPEISSASIWNLALLAVPNNGSSSLEKQDIDRVKVFALTAFRNQKADSCLRISGAKTCSRLGLIEVLPELRIAMNNSAEEVTFRVAAIESLGTLKDHGSRLHLVELAQSDSQKLRKAAGIALQELGPKE